MVSEPTSRQTYIARDRWLHWSLTAVVAAQFGTRIAADSQDVPVSTQNLLMAFHLTGGLATIALTLALLAGRRRRPPESNRSASWGHKAIYLALLVQGATGIAASFGLSSIGVAHRAVSGLIMLLCAGHVIAAFWHHLVRRDDTLRDMIGTRIRR